MYWQQYWMMRNMKPYRRFSRLFPRIHFFSFTLGISLSLFASFFQLFTSSPVPVANPDNLVLSLNTTTKGGGAMLNLSYTIEQVSHPNTHEVFADLLAFTGLNESELLERLQRSPQYHFAIEHRFRDPQSPRELALFYRHSLGYLWGNAIHQAENLTALSLTASNGPVLDFSGGVGSNCLALAKLGIECIYTGVGLAEFEFAQFRATRHGVDHMIQFIKPYARGRFDPLGALELENSLSSQLGAILALDVFEHIPDYHVTAQHLVSLLKDGGVLYERSPFNDEAESDEEIHLKASIPMHEALSGMTSHGRIPGSKIVVWVKDIPNTKSSHDSNSENVNTQTHNEEHINESKNNIDIDKLHVDESENDSEINPFDKRAE